ncbi:MAG: tetratricopeptide repeat protein [Cytophagales bacterium]|nr:MAG: tetratricopeptide repeat protein [Cytophagales bacterium]TAF59955.1 MAG: tetratricopeptide repeat protein [Cytophagales bacterium]
MWISLADWGGAYCKLGDIYSAQGDLNQALAFYKKGLGIFESLSSLEPSNVNFSRELAISYSNLGDVYDTKGDLDQALELYEKACDISESLSCLEPSNVGFSRGLGFHIAN